jgi:hypothetical protein
MKLANDEWHVNWDIEVSADTPEQAAQEAWNTIEDMDATGVFFTVTNHKGERFEVDLMWGEARAKVKNVATGQITYHSL